jgi:hypothetical protein
LCCAFGTVSVDDTCIPYNKTFQLNTTIIINEQSTEVDLATEKYKKRLVYGIPDKCNTVAEMEGDIIIFFEVRSISEFF